MSFSSITSSLSLDNSSQDNSSQTNNCEWTINVSYCFGQEFFQIVYGVTTYLSLFIFLCSIWLLSWRIYSKPGIRLFKIKGFLTLEGYLFIQIFWGAARVISCVILIYNLFPGQWIVRGLVIELAWFLGLTSVVTYLAGVLRTIPRVHFYTQNPHYKHALHLPNLRGIAGAYISYILVLGTIRITCTVFSGYFRQYPSDNSENLFKIANVIYYCTCSISALIVAVGFIIYGNKLVAMANEALHSLEGVCGYPSKGSRSSRVTPSIFGAELKVKHKKLQRSIRMMRIINAAFVLSFVALGVSLGVYAFMSDQIRDNLEVSQILAAVSNWMPMILNVCVMAGIAYGEMRIPDKSEPRLENIIIPTSSEASRMEHISDVGSAYHSRNSSTDSEAPLLRWPAPAVTSARRGSAQLDSPISVVSSSSTSPLNSTPFTSTQNASTSNNYNTSMSSLP